MVTALEFSAAIRWSFDPMFSPYGADEPCSGNGYVRPISPSNFMNLDQQAIFSDLFCECLEGFIGKICQRIFGENHQN